MESSLPGFVIDARGIEKSFGTLKAVDGVSLQVKPGECFGILGPNGAGKTTTIKMLHGAVESDSGTLRVLGRDVATQSRLIRAQMGIVSQEDTLDRDLTVYENLWVYAGFFSIPKKASLTRIEYLLDFMQLREKWDSQIKTLSGGMKRRLHIARALIHEPKFLILDEPTTGLDPQARHLVWQRLRELKAQGLTILLTTHYMEEAAQMCDRIGIMDGGKFLVEGPPQTLVQEKVGDEVYELKGGASIELLDSLQGLSVTTEIVADILYLYSRNGMGIMEHLISFGRKDFLRRPATLEDLFLKLTGRELRD